MRRWFALIGPLAIMAIACWSAAQADVLFITPDGNDSWSGELARPNADRTDGPLATLQGARDAIRRKKERRPLTDTVRVVVAEGEYAMKEPLVLGPRDSGAPGAPVIYEAARGARPVFSGMARMTGFKQKSGGLWQADVPEVRAGKWYFEQLFVNGRRATRARTPNAGYLPVLARVEQGLDPLTGRQSSLGNRAFKAPAEIAATLASLPPAELRDVNIVAYQAWEISRLRPASASRESGIVVTTGPAAWPFNQWGNDQRFHLENLRSALDQPGEWFLSREGVLSYIPLPGEVISSSVIQTPVADLFLRIEGKQQDKVHDVWFRGLAFSGSRFVLPEAGQSDSQAAVSQPAVVQVDHAKDLLFENCEIARTGIYGLWLRKGCTGCRVIHCYLNDLGAGGVRIGETALREDGPDRTSANEVDNCIIHNWGNIDYGAVGVWIGQSGGNKVTHNDIGDGCYTAVSVGWTWGYGPSLARNNTIDYNRIHDIGRGVLSDMGGVYTLGVSDGTSVSNNVIFNVDSYDRYGRGGWGLYTDEGSSHITLENNLVYHIKTGTVHQHYGRENVFRNNILAWSRDGQLQRSRVEPHLSFTFERNIVLWKEGPLFSGSWGDSNVKMDHNLYWNESGAPVAFEGKTLKEWQTSGKDAGSLVADPKFIDPESGDFHLRPDSPALKLGFKPFDYRRAGVYGSSEWEKLAFGQTERRARTAGP